MILPSKHISQKRALLTVGSLILESLQQPKTASALWENFRNNNGEQQISTSVLSYDEFVLVLDLLFLIDAIEMEDGLLIRKKL